MPGTGTGGPWRYVHSLLGGIDLDEFDVSLFCDLPGHYDARPEVRVVPLADLAPAAGGAGTAANADWGVWRDGAQRLFRRFPEAVRLWAGFGRNTGALARLFRRSRLDLLHTQNTGCEESPVAARLAGLSRVVGTFHVDSTCDVTRTRSGMRYRALELLSNHCLDRAIAVSRAAGRDWVQRTRISPHRVTTIYNGIDPQKFRRRMSRGAARSRLGLPPCGGPVVGAVGRLDPAKGFTYLLDAVARLKGAHPSIVLVIAGYGPERAELEDQASRLGISDSVKFLGFQQHVQWVLDSLDLFVIPSLTETLGYACLEAMAAGLPAVGTAVGGIPEVIVPEETGLLVSPRDADGLARAIHTLLQSPDLREQMGAAGRLRVVRHFRESEMVRKTIDLYREVLSARPARDGFARSAERLTGLRSEGELARCD
ncbi:MAG: glycosyltransferase family 4 protein [Gemmataceae bacterium]